MQILRENTGGRKVHSEISKIVLSYNKNYFEKKNHKPKIMGAKIPETKKQKSDTENTRSKKG